MKKGVSIPINTLVMLAVAIIVLLAAVAWFMGAFSPTAQEQTYGQRFRSKCTIWAMTNCDGSAEKDLCEAYEDATGEDLTCPTGTDDNDKKEVAKACGCIKPYGT